MKNFNTIFNQLTAMPKRLAMVLTVLFTLGVGSMWGEIIEINTTNFTKTSSGSGYAVYDGTRTIAEVDIYSSNVMVQSSKLQFKSNSGLLYNTSAIPGTITKITLETTTNFTIHVGESSNPTSTTATSGSSIIGNYSYFAIKGGGSTPKTSKITIEYTPTGGNTGDGSGDIGDCNVTYDFTKINFTGWSNSYAERIVKYEDATVTFEAASKQTTNITDRPVTKGKYVSLVMTDGSTLSSVTWVCKQWTTKAQTITLHYSTNGGTSYTTTGVTSTNFTISKDNLPAGTNAVKITFSSTDNQIGISSCSIEKVCTTETTVDLYHNDGTISGGGWILSGNKYTQTVETTNDNVVLPTPEKEGYTFGGWYESSAFDAAGSAVTEIEAGTTGTKEFYAKWTINRYTLTWNLNGGKVIVAGTHASVDATGSPSGYVNYNVSVNVPEVAKEGHYFTGWTEDGTNVVTPLTKMPARDVTYIALWEEAGCPEYSFHTGGDNVKEINTQICFEPVGSNNEWQIVNYVIPADTKYFVGHHGYWYENNLGSNNSRSVVKTWSEAMYLAPAMDPSNPNGTPKVGQATGAVGTIRIFDNSNWDNLYVGFIPNGYKLKFGTTEYAFAHKENSEYLSDIVEYNATSANYNASAGITNVSGDYVATDHTQEMRHIFVKDNKGWRNDGAKLAIYYWNGSTNGWCGFLKTVPGDATLFEGWIPASYTSLKFVRFSNTKGAVGDWDDKWNETGDLTISSGNNLFTITDWGTGSWSAYSRKGKFRIYNDSKDKNWYLHFYPHNVLIYDANSGSGTMASQSVPADATSKSVTVSANGFTRTGYNFVKWNKNASGTGTSYNPGETYTLSADVILYAQWEAKKITITWDANGGSVDPTTSTYTYNGTPVELPTPTRANYIFNGWFTATSGGTQIADVGTTNKPTDDVTYYAQWTEKAVPTFAWSAPSYTAALEADNTFPTLSNPNSLSVTYTSSDENVAKIDENGNIVLGSEGRTTITAIGAESATHKSATDTYELTVVAANCKWVETTTIEDGDEVVITMTGTNGTTYTLDNTPNTTEAPSVVEVNNISGTYIMSVVDGVKWVVNKDGGDLTFKSYLSDNYLYCTNNNNGVRVGNTGSSRIFIIDNESGYLKHTVTNRYLGVYNNQDWRCYTVTTSVIAGQTLKFYKKECLDSEHYWVTWDAGEGAWSDGSTKKLKSYEVGATITAPAENPTREGYRFDGWTPTPTTMPAENTTFTAQWTELYTVNFYSNGIEVCSFEEIAGQTVNCTNTPTTCDDEYPHFIGWTDTEIDGVATDKPALVTLPLTVSESQDYHAVFAKGTLATGGDAETVTFANSGYSNQQTISTVTLTNATITFAIGSNNNNAPKYYTTGAAIRCYGGNTFTVKSDNEITNISLSFATGEDSNEITANVGTYSNGVWTGSAKSITFTIAGSSGHRRIASISVTAGSPENLTEFITSCCTPWAAPTLSANTSIVVGGTTTITYSGTTYGDVTYTSSNTDVATVDANGKVTGVKPGKTTITASWDGVDGSGNYCPAEATIDVTVTGSFTITYDANHASATGATTATTIAYPTGQGTVATNGFALAEHQFVKWNTSADGSGTSYSEGASITLTDNITLYAIWQRYCTITYVIPAGGGTLAAGATTTVVAGGAVQMPGIENNSIDLEYSCEELIGWTTNSATHEAAGIKPDPFYAIGASLSGITQNTTLYAVYSRAGNGLGGTVTLTAEEMEGWATAQSYGTERELTTCVGTWKTTGVKSTGNPIQLRATDNPYVEFPELQGNIMQVVLNATNGSNATLTSGTFTLKTIDGQTITSASVNSSGVCTLTVTGSHKTARLYSSVTARIANISISYGPAAIISTTLSCTNDIDECTVTYDLNESFLPTGTTVYGACADATFLFSEIGTYTICASPRANEHQFLGWNNQCDGKGSISYTPGQVVSSLPQNNIVLYAQWAPQVIVHDSYEETFVYPTQVGGSITLNPGTQGCDPKKYDFIGWTDVNPLTGNSTESAWNQANTPPTLLPTNSDGTVTYTPDGPSEVYAVYALEDEANSDAFIISATVSGTVYYAKSHTNYYLRATTDKSEAVKLYKERMASGTNTYFMYYVDDNGEKQYLYSNSGDLNTSTNPGATYGWQFIQSGSGYKFKSTNGDEKCLSTNGNSFTLVNESNLSVLFTMETVAEYQYVAKTNCTDEVTITFVPGNGIMTPSNTTVTAKPSDVITLPTCEFSGWTFLGWVTDNVEETERPNVMTIYTDAFEVGNSDITLYAYYTCDPEPVPFDGNTDGVWKIYSEVTSGTYKYANSHSYNNPTTLPASDYCPNAEDWTFVNAGEPYKYYIKNEAGRYLTPENEVNTGFTFGTTPQVWNIESAGNDLYKISHADIPGRLIMCGTTAFYNTVKANIDNPAWHLVSIGGCTNSVYTTDPQEKEAISIAGTLKITSAVGQTVKAADKIILSMKNMPAAQVFNISADNLTFYNENNQVVTSLQAGDNGSLTAILAVAYTPTEADKLETPQIKIEYAGKIRGFRNVTCRSLPASFAIVAKVGEMWYALPSQGLNSTDALVGYPVEVNNMADPTAVTAVPANADWSLRQVYKTSGVNDRYTTNGHNLVFVNNEGTPKALNASKDYNYLLTDAQYANYYATNPGLYEWTPTTTDLETYTLTNVQRTTKKVNINTNTVFGVHASEVATTEVRFLPIQNRYTPMAAQVVEWKENSVVVMYNGNPTQTAQTSINGTNVGSVTLANVQKDIAVYELPADGLGTKPNQTLSVTIGSEKLLLPTPYMVNSEVTDDVLLGSSLNVQARRDIAKVSNLVILKGGKLTSTGAKTNPYTFRNVTIYGGGTLVVSADKGFGANTLTMRVGGVENREYVYTYPQLDLNGTINSGNINLDLMTTNDYYYPFSVPYEVTLSDIHYPTEIYGSNVNSNNTGSFLVSYYDGAERALGKTGWKDVEGEGKKTLSPRVGYSIWGLPKKVSVNGATSVRQTYGIHRIPMRKSADEVMKNEIQDCTVSISAYDATRDNDKGWNFIGNPYLVQHGGLDGNDTDIQMGLLEKEIKDGQWTGGWVFNGEQVRYVTQTNDCLNYISTPVASATIPAFSAFFIQAAQTGAIAFTSPNVAAAQSLTARRSDENKEITTGIILSGEKHSDRTGLLIADKFTEAYEFNADLSKFDNQDMNLYTISPSGKLAFMAINEELAKQTIPLGYSVSADGMYTIAFDEQRYNRNDIYALYLIDYDRNETTNLLHMDYDFYSDSGASAERFALQVAFAPSTTTDVEYTQVGDILLSREGNTLRLDNLPSNATVTIYDAVGHLIEQHTASQLLQLTLQKGYYLLHIGNNQHSVVIDTFIP